MLHKPVRVPHCGCADNTRTSPQLLRTNATTLGRDSVPKVLPWAILRKYPTHDALRKVKEKARQKEELR